MQEPKYKWEIAIAGLIHDIGKLYQKSASAEVSGMKIRKKSDEHPLMASDFIDKHLSLFEQVPGLDIEFIRQCAVRHHNGQGFSDEVVVAKAPTQYKKYCQIINIADNLSSSERSKMSAGRKELATLVPFFVRLDKDLPARQYAYDLTRYSSKSFKIISTDNGKHTPEKMDKFITEFEESIDNSGAITKQSLFEHLNRVIRDFAWCLPSDVREEIRDVSLYQHLVTTSAIASAIYADLVACSDNEDFAIVSVEKKEDNIKLIHLQLTGSDDYTLKDEKKANNFDILDSISRNKASLEVKYKEAINELVNNMQLTQANRVISSGFEEYILFGDQSESEIINEVRKINEELKDTYRGEVYISYSIQDLNFLDVEGSKYKRMSSVFSGKSEQLVNGLYDILSTPKGWDTTKFIINDDTEETDEQLGYLEDSFRQFRENLKDYGNKIAFIFVDGDKVLEKMETGFISGDVNNATISRVSTYSNIMRTFFDAYIENNFDECYFININANRFVMACSIQDILGKVKDIKDMFSEYTLGTMTLSISIGVYNLNDRTTYIADYNNKSLAKVKQSGGNLVRYKSISLDDSDLDKCIDMGSMVHNSMSNTNALERLAVYSSMYKDYIKTKDVSKLICHPLYVRSRSKDVRTIDQGLIKLLDVAFNKVFNGDKGVCKELYLLETVINDALIEHRMMAIGGMK